MIINDHGGDNDTMIFNDDQPMISTVVTMMLMMIFNDDQ